MEARWYVLFPLILTLWIRWRRAFWLVGAACFLLYHFTRVTAVDLAILPAFMLGIVAANIRITGAPYARLALAMLPSVAVYAIAFDRGLQQDTFSWQFAAFLFVIAAGGLTWLESVLSWRALTFIGVASYSIYLYHEPVEQLVIGWFRVSWIASALIGLAFGILAWAVVERWVLLPSVKLDQLRCLTDILIAVLVGSALERC